MDNLSDKHTYISSFEKEQHNVNKSIEIYKKSIEMDLKKINKNDLLQTKIVKKTWKYKIMYFLYWCWYHGIKKRLKK